MRAISQVTAIAVAAGPFLLACDDTGRDVKREAAEAGTEVRHSAGGGGARIEPGGVVVDIDSQKVKEGLREAGTVLKEGAESAAESVKEAIDEADKDAVPRVYGGEGGAR
jgi:hypothetical protein